MKLNKYIYIPIVATCMMLPIASCSDYLDIKPYDKVIPETAEDFSALLHNILNDIDQGNGNELVPSLSDASNFDTTYGDDFEVCLTGAGAFTLSNYVGDCIKNNWYNNTYAGLYENIKDANIVIGNIVEQDSEEARNVIGTAYAIRAVAYYQLLRQFCEIPDPSNLDGQLGVPLVTVFDMEATPARNTMAQTINRIETDILTSLSFHITDPLYLFTEDVMKGYLARLYFWSRRWQDCLNVCQELLIAHPLVDRDSYQAMMNEFSKLAGNQLIKNYRATSVTGTNSVSSIQSNISYRPLSVRYTSNYYDDEKETDIRYKMFVNTKRQVVKPIFCGMRGAEFKLMEAECLYHLNRTSDALKSINDFRRMRIKDYTDIDMDKLPPVNAREIMKIDVNGNPITPLLGTILRERRKEFLMEYDRWFELKRNGTPEFSCYYNNVKYTTLSYMYTFPIPIRELDITDNLVQNPGYTDFVDNDN